MGCGFTPLTLTLTLGYMFGIPNPNPAVGIRGLLLATATSRIGPYSLSFTSCYVSSIDSFNVRIVWLVLLTTTIKHRVIRKRKIRSRWWVWKQFAPRAPRTDWHKGRPNPGKHEAPSPGPLPDVPVWSRGLRGGKRRTVGGLSVLPRACQAQYEGREYSAVLPLALDEAHHRPGTRNHSNDQDLVDAVGGLARRCAGRV